MKKVITFILVGMLSTSIFAGNSSCAFDDFTCNAFMIRVRALYFKPDESSSTITNIGGKVEEVSHAIVPEVDFTYFFTKNIAAELILASTKHTVDARGTTLDVNHKTKLGIVKLIPATLLAQFHLLPDQMFDPYVGVGINYTYFYEQNQHATLTDIKYDDSVGAAFQAGVDINIGRNWYVNLDVKKVLVETDVAVTAGATVAKTTVTLDPYVLGAGFGYKFS